LLDLPLGGSSGTQLLKSTDELMCIHIYDIEAAKNAPRIVACESASRLGGKVGMKLKSFVEMLIAAFPTHR